jgi:SAM-dependent methyltransferase
VSAKSVVAKQVNRALQPLNFQIIKGKSADPAVRPYRSARRTMGEARKAGLSVSAWIDQNHAEPGATPALVKAMLSISGLSGKCGRVCEIGPGTGRYAEEVIAALHPDAYEVYETERSWIPVLRKLPNAIIRHCEGRTLSQTPDASIDLVHAQKVFTYLPFFATAGYMAEMARVVRPGGTVAFDVATEDCLDDPTVLTWIERGTIYHPFPKAWAVDFLQRRGLTLLGTATTPLPPGKSELLVFRRAR